MEPSAAKRLSPAASVSPSSPAWSSGCSTFVSIGWYAATGMSWGGGAAMAIAAATDETNATNAKASAPSGFRT